MSRLITAASVAVVLVLAWCADHYHGKAESWRNTALSYQHLAGKQAATINDMALRQQQLAELDKTHTEALSAAESENDALRRQLAAGTRRMYVHAKCPVSGAGATADTSKMGDGAAVELATDSRQNILDIRAGIISDQAKVKYLQQYIIEQCLR